MGIIKNQLALNFLINNTTDLPDPREYEHFQKELKRYDFLLYRKYYLNEEF